MALKDPGSVKMHAIRFTQMDYCLNQKLTGGKITIEDLGVHFMLGKYIKNVPLL